MPEDFDEGRLPRALAGLDALALDLRWACSHRAYAIWDRIGPELWRASRNPWAVLTAAGRGELETLANDAPFVELVRGALDDRRRRLSEPMWFQTQRSESPLKLAAYFSMEFGLSEAVPIYSGGLGVLAGDLLKSATDLGVPVAGVGLLYQEGYFRQALDAAGNQHELNPANDPSEMPLRRARDRSGGFLRIPLEFPGRTVYLRAWIANVGRVSLYLLDSNDPANSALDRGITAQLYSGASEVRLQQEMILGAGGWRLLRALGFDPDVLHLNEGHAALAVFERAQSIANEQRIPFHVALTIARAGTVFTTHTPVAAAFDRFEPSLVARYVQRYATDQHVGLDELLALAREPDGAAAESFNMAYLAIRGSGWVNGVSRLHGEVSRGLFAPLFPRWPAHEVPCGHVTNGVHVPSWDSRAAAELWRTAGDAAPWLGALSTIEERVAGIAQADVWSMRAISRRRLVTHVRERFSRQLSEAGAAPDRIDDAQRVLDENVLTLGFARRFTEYKRPTLLLRDPDRLARLIANAARPVQFVVAGKAHPRDEPGKAMIRAWFEFAERPDVRERVVLLSDYDLVVAEELVHGVDVWINTPRRPWEASGTSGMKVLCNGGLNCSELDGWWAEAYVPEVGWAIGDGREHGGDPAAEAADAEALYRLLEDEIVPQFYERDDAGIPQRWVEKIRASMTLLTPQFSSNRMLREYTTGYYEPAAAAYRKRLADGARLGREIQEWRGALEAHWDEVSLGTLHVERTPNGYEFRILASFGAIDPAAVRVELYAEPRDPSGMPERIAMQRGEPIDHVAIAYTATLGAGESPERYTPRVVPYHPDASVPLEASGIRWQH